MANTGLIHIVGRLTADPELRFTPSGHAVANLSVAVNRQRNDNGTWVEDGADFYNCILWRQYAENATTSLQKGDMVTVNGRMKSRTYDAKDGTPRTVWEVDIDEIGPSLRFATVSIEKNASAKWGGAKESPNWDAPPEADIPADIPADKPAHDPRRTPQTRPARR